MDRSYASTAYLSERIYLVVCSPINLWLETPELLLEKLMVGDSSLLLAELTGAGGKARPRVISGTQQVEGCDRACRRYLLQTRLLNSQRCSAMSRTKKDGGRS